jgi:hypothetical protein
LNIKKCFLITITFLFSRVLLGAPEYLLTWTEAANGIYTLRYAIGTNQMQMWNVIPYIGFPVQVTAPLNWYSTSAAEAYLTLYNAVALAPGPTTNQGSLSDPTFFQVAAYQPTTGEMTLLMGPTYTNSAPQTQQLIEVIQAIATPQLGPLIAPAASRPR